MVYHMNRVRVEHSQDGIRSCQTNNCLLPRDTWGLSNKALFHILDLCFVRNQLS